jgi:putative addiction module component (TIGR02574 family)
VVNDALAKARGSFQLGPMTAAVLKDLLHLPKRARLEIAEQLWLSVADEVSMPVPASHKRILKKRLADYKSGASQPIPHAELMRRVRSA